MFVVIFNRSDTPFEPVTVVDMVVVLAEPIPKLLIPPEVYVSQPSVVPFKVITPC